MGLLCYAKWWQPEYKHKPHQKCPENVTQRNVISNLGKSFEDYVVETVY